MITTSVKGFLLGRVSPKPTRAAFPGCLSGYLPPVLSSGRAIVLLCALTAAGLAAGSAAAAAATPKSKTVYRDGPSGRYLLAEGWYDRPDPSVTGERDGFQRAAGLAGWRAAGAPVAANAGDYSIGSYTGFVHWYRNDFELPRGGRGARWVIRFESVNYRARVWLNGRRIGGHVGAYLPFELPAGRPGGDEPPRDPRRQPPACRRHPAAVGP